MQIRADTIKAERPDCPRGCSGRLHLHGCYQRYVHPAGSEKLAVQRLLCVLCGHTVSILPADRLPYRPLEVKRLQAHFDAQAGVGPGPDPPPELIEAGCLKRAWMRFLTRVDVIRNALGQILPVGIRCALKLWKQLRQRVGPTTAILGQLAQCCKRSLLGDYLCLRPAP